MKFEEIKSVEVSVEYDDVRVKICPNVECNQFIPEDWEACFQNDFCPKCGYGYDGEKIAKWRELNGKN